ncbi:MAG: hypothetical protein RLZZ403_1749 [Pseudomonadota bacterium]
MGRNDGWRWWAPRHLTRLLDVWEPLIRADERERNWAEWEDADVERTAAIRSDERDKHKDHWLLEWSGLEAQNARLLAERADLRAKVRELFANIAPPYLFPITKETLMPDMETTTVHMALMDVWKCAEDEVLGLIDEALR